MFECYNNIVGLTDKDCDCINTGRPADYNTSQSELFLSDLMEIGKLINLGKCDDTMWDLLVDSRDLAVKQTVANTNIKLKQKYTLKRQPAVGQIIGEIKSKDDVTAYKNYAVVRLNCHQIKSGLMTIKNIGTVFSATGAISVGLYNNVDGLLQTIPLNTTAGKQTLNIVSIELPMYSKYTEQLEYYLVYLFDAANMPKDTEVDCGCGSWIPVFDTEDPYYLRRETNNKRLEWTQYIMAGGLQINSLTELDDLDEELTTVENNMYGLNLEIDFSCNLGETLCKDSLDFVGNPLALSLAFSILYKTAINIGEKVVNDTTLSRETLINSEIWEDEMIEWQGKYLEHLDFIVASIDLQSSDCLTCKDILGMTRQGIFA